MSFCQRVERRPALPYDGEIARLYRVPGDVDIPARVAGPAFNTARLIATGYPNMAAIDA